MPDTTNDGFLSGQGIAVDPREIETELTRLWGPAAERVGGPELENPHVTRIVLANVVVLSRKADGERLQQVLDTVTERYPCRTIVLCRTDDPARKIAAEVSALCHLPAPGLPQVCSERIILRAGPNAVDLLPGAVRPLLEADLPFVLWWTDDPRDDEALFRGLADECSRLILDLPDPGADPEAVRFGLDLMISRYSRDTAWFGLLPWRELVAQLFDPPGNDEALARIDSVRIEAVSRTDKSPPRIALWLVAWLAGQLGWTPRGYPGRSAGRFKAIFKGSRGLVAVEIETEAVPTLDVAQLSAITLTARGDVGVDTFRLSRPAPQSNEVRVEVDCIAYCSLPRVVEARDFDPALRVAAALERSRNDLSYQQALPHALWLLDSLKD